MNNHRALKAKRLTHKTVLLLFIMSLAAAWSNAQSRPIRGQELPWPPAKGTTSFVLTPAPGTEPSTLKQLVDTSSLIIDGLVESLSVRQIPQAQRLETDVKFRVLRVLKGPAAAATLVVTQRGGILGGYTEQPTQYALMKVGERYILVASDDKRPGIPPVTGNLRVLITGEWAGNMRVAADNTVHLSSGAASDLRRQYEGISVDQLLSAIATSLKPQ
jgi:hypothetical protein